MEECQLEHVLKQNPNLFIVQTPLKNLSITRMNSEDENHAKK